MQANPNYTYLKKNVPEERYTLLQGGTRSGKTYAIIYYIIWLCENYSGMEIDICRNEFAALKATVWKDFKEVLVKHNMYDATMHHKTDKYYLLNGNIINYYGADDPRKIHGRSRQILWLNEAHQFDEETINQLFPRTESKIIMDYNPSMPTEHWLDKYIEHWPPCITTYRDNPFLTKGQVAEIESNMDNDYWWCVYGTGQRTKPVGTIFNNWKTGEFDESLPYIYGMDFGYVNDPTTLAKVAVDNKHIYAKELLYKTHMTTTDIVDFLGQVVTTSDLIIADNAEPRLIEEIRQKGFNIRPCEKGRDSVRLGLAKMQGYQIVIGENDYNLKKELSNYVWHDKKSNTPVDAHNHLIDAIRYSVDELSQEKGMFFG